MGMCRVLSKIYISILLFFLTNTGSHSTCQAILQGHTSLVGQLQMRGTTLVTGGSDGSVRVWSLETFTPIHRLAAHDNSVTSLQFDDTRIVSGGSDGRVKIWDLKTGTLIRELSQPAEAVWRVAFEEERSVVLASRQGRTVMEVWDFAPPMEEVEDDLAQAEEGVDEMRMVNTVDINEKGRRKGENDTGGEMYLLRKKELLRERRSEHIRDAERDGLLGRGETSAKRRSVLGSVVSGVGGVEEEDDVLLHGEASQSRFDHLGDLNPPPPPGYESFEHAMAEGYAQLDDMLDVLGATDEERREIEAAGVATAVDMERGDTDVSMSSTTMMMD